MINNFKAMEDNSCPYCKKQILRDDFGPVCCNIAYYFGMDGKSVSFRFSDFYIRHYNLEDKLIIHFDTGEKINIPIFDFFGYSKDELEKKIRGYLTFV
jgi:hypothetical protein